MIHIIDYIKGISIEDDFERKRVQLMLLEGLIGLICFIMSVINIITRKDILLLSTASMCVLSLCNMFLIWRNKKSMTHAMCFFIVKALVLFTYFIISGGTEGFSTIWFLLIPAFGMFAFGRRIGAAMAGFLFAELVFFFYIPLGRSLLLTDSYTDAFLTRFPVLYISFFSIGYYLEVVRERTYNRISVLHHASEYLATHDHLTGLSNRGEFSRLFAKYVSDAKNGRPFAFLLIDVDHFKSINDTYGHLVGDEVLKKVAAKILETTGGADSFRWGGEEFAVLLQCSAKDMGLIAERVRNEINLPMSFDGQEFAVSVSIGGAYSLEWDEITSKEMIRRADDRLYSAKNIGRNRCRVDDSAEMI